MTSSHTAQQFLPTITEQQPNTVQRERERETEMWKTSVVRARRGPQPFFLPTILGDDVIIHIKKMMEKNVSVPRAQLEQK